MVGCCWLWSDVNCQKNIASSFFKALSTRKLPTLCQASLNGYTRYLCCSKKQKSVLVNRHNRHISITPVERSRQVCLKSMVFRVIQRCPLEIIGRVAMVTRGKRRIIHVLWVCRERTLIIRPSQNVHSTHKTQVILLKDVTNFVHYHSRKNSMWWMLMEYVIDVATTIVLPGDIHLIINSANFTLHARFLHVE